MTTATASINRTKQNVSVRIELKDFEDIERVANVGLQRRLVAIKKNKKDCGNFSKVNYWNNDIEAAAAEFVVAKYFGMHWFDLVDNHNNLPDVADDTDLSQAKCIIDVKSTINSSGRLLVNKVRDDWHYVLVTGCIPKFDIRGYLTGRNVKVRERTDICKKGMYLYEWNQWELNSIERLRETIVA